MKGFVVCQRMMALLTYDSIPELTGSGRCSGWNRVIAIFLLGVPVLKKILCTDLSGGFQGFSRGFRGSGNEWEGNCLSPKIL